MHRVMVSYLKASKEQRALMEAAMPDVFTPDVCAELASADDVIRDSTEAARDAMSFGNALLREVAPPSASATAASNAEAASARGITLYDDDGLPFGSANANGNSGGGAEFDEADLMGDGLTTFEEILAGLMAKQAEAMSLIGRGEPQPAELEVGEAEGDSAAASSGGAKGGQLTVAKAAQRAATERAGCVLLPSSILSEIFSYLPVLDIIETAEHVCHYWNRVTTASATSQAFWIGCVHREYPSQLAALVAAEGPSLFEADWRTIATVIVCNELACDSDEEGEDGDEDDDEANATA